MLDAPAAQPRPGPQVNPLLRIALISSCFTLLAAPLAADEHAASTAQRLTRIARLLAGAEPLPGDTAIDALAASRQWIAHRDASKNGFKLVKTRLDRMTGWSAAHLPLPPGAGETLLYPFSGPDLLNAYALFPDHDTYVFFSLEPVGSVPDVTRLESERFNALLADLRAALNDIVLLNFFITPNMEKRMRTTALSGVTPVLLSMLGLMELDVVRVELLDLWPERTAALLVPGAKRPALPLSAVQIDFKNPRLGKVQHLIYLSLDVSDKALAFYPEFVPWLAAFQKPTVFMKSASYLLHMKGFNDVRDLVLQHAALLVQDDTGVPYAKLLAAGFEVSLFGQYEQPVKLFERRYQKDLAQAFVEQPKTAPVPFPFGYNWRREGRSFVISARRPGS